jgi:hypothetical protein
VENIIIVIVLDIIDGEKNEACFNIKLPLVEVLMREVYCCG